MSAAIRSGGQVRELAIRRNVMRLFIPFNDVFGRPRMSRFMEDPESPNSVPKRLRQDQLTFRGTRIHPQQDNFRALLPVHAIGTLDFKLAKTQNERCR
jgi:hypothetical protein